MYAESYRPTLLHEVIGHSDAKQRLEKYLKPPFIGAVFLVGSPGIGKTTIASCAARTFNFDPLEINASRSIRSYEDVMKLKDACRSSVNIHSLIRGDTQRKTCVILDEIDGSDPHAQTKIIDWIADPGRGVPIICTGNETPTIFKRNYHLVDMIRCFTPKASELEHLFPGVDIASVLKECQHDIRRVFHRIQYGESYKIPKIVLPPTGTAIEKVFVEKQKQFGLKEPLEYLAGKLDSEHSH